MLRLRAEAQAKQERNGNNRVKRKAGFLQRFLVLIIGFVHSLHSGNSNNAAKLIESNEWASQGFDGHLYSGSGLLISLMKPEAF